MDQAYSIITDYASYIDSVQFRVNLPRAALPVSQAELEGIIIPYGFGEDLDSWVGSAVTINFMINAYNGGVRFEILDWEDVILIYNALCNYKIQMVDVAEVPNVKEFISKVDTFLSVMALEVKKAFIHRPELEFKYKKPSDGFINTLAKFTNTVVAEDNSIKPIPRHITTPSTKENAPVKKSIFDYSPVIWTHES